MDEIPTYEELKKRVRELEKETTELRRAKEMLRLEKDKFQLIMSGLSSAEIGIDIVGIDYTVIFQNQFLEDRFGNLTGWLCYEKYMGMEEPCDFCPMVQAVRNNKIENVELAGNDGRVYEVFSTPLPNPDGTVDKAFEIVRDITNRKRAEEVLKESEEKFRSALMGLPIMVNAVDQNGTIVFWNKKCEEITGYTATEMIGNCNAMELLYPDKEYLETELQKWKTQNYKLKNAELVSRAKDGSAKTVLWTNPDFSTPEWIWAVGIDITKQKREEVALHEAYRIINRSPAVAILWKNMEGWNPLGCWQVASPTT